ncbi:hypothetical protein OK016_02465 [Vibrio chagasii]|nr:hypothetical protein [Vibrio chagasii]
MLLKAADVELPQAGSTSSAQDLLGDDKGFIIVEMNKDARAG